VQTKLARCCQSLLTYAIKHSLSLCFSYLSSFSFHSHFSYSTTQLPTRLCAPITTRRRRSAIVLFFFLSLGRAHKRSSFIPFTCLLFNHTTTYQATCANYYNDDPVPRSDCLDTPGKKPLPSPAGIECNGKLEGESNILLECLCFFCYPTAGTTNPTHTSH
jgi:hypothetical protein